MSETGTCKKCGKIVLWVETQNGKRMPLDKDPERRYVIDAAKNPIMAKQRNTFTCHFDTCKGSYG